MFYRFLFILLCTVVSWSAWTQNSQHLVDNVPVEKFEEPSTQFEYGTYINDVRTIDEQSQIKYYSKCAIFVEELEDKRDPACIDLQTIYLSALSENPKSVSNPITDEDWAFARQRFECGFYSHALLTSMHSDEKPWGLFSASEIDKVKSAMPKIMSSQSFQRDPSDEDDPNRYECVDYEFVDFKLPDISGIMIQSTARRFDSGVSDKD